MQGVARRQAGRVAAVITTALVEPKIVQISRPHEKMKLYEAIEAHLAWKKRLLDHIDGDQQVDPQVAGSDVDCTLGRWIIENAETYGEFPLFQKLQDEHIAFHRYAEEVAIAALNDEAERAHALLDAEYNTMSKAIIRTLARLRQEISEDG